MAEASKLSAALRVRVVIVLMLAVGGLVLFMANRVTETIEKRTVMQERRARPLLQEVNEIVDTLLDRHRINPRWVTSWNVSTRDRRFIRQERRVYVPPGFVSLDFNHDLSQLLAQHDTRVVASERTKEESVSMHVIHDGMIIESITFVLKRDLK